MTKLDNVAVKILLACGVCNSAMTFFSFGSDGQYIVLEDGYIDSRGLIVWREIFYASSTAKEKS